MRPQRPNKYKNKRTFKQDDNPTVPSYIIDKFKAISGVTEVKIVAITRQRINLTLVVDRKYDKSLFTTILLEEANVRQTLRPRRQDIEASIGWQ